MRLRLISRYYDKETIDVRIKTNVLQIILILMGFALAGGVVKNLFVLNYIPMAIFEIPKTRLRRIETMPTMVAVLTGSFSFSSRLSVFMALLDDEEVSSPDFDRPFLPFQEFVGDAKRDKGT